MKRSLAAIGGLTAEDLAKAARLRYVSDQEAGIARKRNGSGFEYFSSRGSRVRNERQLRRIENLVIPPAWREVWICALPSGHLQATGRDARKRKQYRYHDRWQEIANVAKFARLVQFGKLLPTVRQAVARDLRGRELTAKRVMAGMVALLDLTGIRVGNEEYVKENGSYGLTTLRNRHVRFVRGGAELRFRAKGGFQREVLVEDKRLVRLISQCAKLPGSHLFQYLDDEGKRHAVTASDVNDYLHELTGEEITAKDFRTWKASAMAVGQMLTEAGKLTEEASEGARKRLVRGVVNAAAELLSNTPTVCRAYYIHPGLTECFLAGSFAGHFDRFRPRSGGKLAADEQALVRFLRRWKPTVE